MDKVLNADDIALAELLLNDLVGRDADALSLHFGETAFVDELDE